MRGMERGAGAGKWMAVVVESACSTVVDLEASGQAALVEHSYPTLLQSRRPQLIPTAESCKATETESAPCEEAKQPAAEEPSAEELHDLSTFPRALAENDAEPEAGHETTTASLCEEAAGEQEHDARQVDEQDAEDDHGQAEIAEHDEAEADAEETESPKGAAERLERAEAARQRAADDEFFWTAAAMALTEHDRRERVGAFLKAHRFSGVNAKRGWFFSYDYPLHCAARHGDVEIVRLLLLSKAAPKQRDSDGRTARQVAKRENYLGSHSAVIKAFREYRRAKRATSVAAAGTGVDSITGLSEKRQGEAVGPMVSRLAEASGTIV